METNTFTRRYVVISDLTYCCDVIDHKGTQSVQGVLHPGRVLWLESGEEDAPVQRAYLEGVGFLSLDGRQRSQLRAA